MRSERGIALITVILVVALTSTAVAFVAWRQQVWTRQVENLRDAGQAEAVARAALDWARVILNEDAGKSGTDHLGENWAQPVAVPVERGNAAGRLTDMQGRFNLNNLVRDGRADPVQIEAFRRLLVTLDLDPALADALADWIDADDLPIVGSGAEAAHYLALDPPYLPANRPLADVAELLRVRGFTVIVVHRLAPYVSALPSFTPVNINTAGAEVVAALIPGMNAQDAAAALAERDDGGRGYENLSQFRNRIGTLNAGNMQDSFFSVSSQYFQADIETGFGRVRQRHAALLQRLSGAKSEVVWMKAL